MEAALDADQSRMCRPCFAKERFAGLDWLRGLAAFGIIGCHLNLGAVTKPAQFVLSFCDLNVGLFAALSGFLMAHAAVARKEIPPAVFLNSRLKRLVPVYLFWTVAYLVFGVMFDLFQGKPVGIGGYSARQWASVFFLGGAACHLWFLICLIYAQILVGVGCITLLRKRTAITCRVLTAVGVLGVCASSCWASQVSRATFASWFTIYFLRLLFFLVFGMGLYGAVEKIRKVPRSVWFSFLVFSGGAHWLIHGFPFGRDLLVVFGALCMGVSCPSLSPRACDLGRGFGEASLGVYIVHPLFAAGGGAFLAKTFSSPCGLKVVLLYWALIWLVSLLATRIGMRIPLLRRVMA